MVSVAPANATISHLLEPVKPSHGILTPVQPSDTSHAVKRLRVTWGRKQGVNKQAQNI